MPFYRNPADLLGLGRDPALSRLLRACGIDESRITGGASDYDKFLALAAALPLCEGHPLKERVESILGEATGLRVPLCPHTARAYWEAWVNRHWYGHESTPPSLPASCPLCPPAEPAVLRLHDLAILPDPMIVQAPDLVTWSQALEAALPPSGRTAVLTLHADFAFIRPDPYHAGLAVRKIADGEAWTDRERNLLTVQALRVWGLALVKAAETRPESHVPPLLLRGGDQDTVTALLAYMDASHALPDTVWIPHDPAHAGAVSGLYARVRTGWAMTCEDTPAVSEDKKWVYAAAAPIGRAFLLIE